MRAGDGHALLEPHEFGEHLGPPNDGNAPRARRDDLRIVAPDGGRNDDHRGGAEIDLVMADMTVAPFSRRRLTLALSESPSPELCGRG